MNKFFKNFFLYLASPILSLVIFALLFQVWKLDFTQPIFGYDRDALTAIFAAKNIVETGWFFSNDSLSFPFKFVMYDFPVHADTLNLALLKFFSLFSSNHFLIVNCFFIATFALASLSAFTALRSFGIKFFIALLISNLYAFLPYHFARGVMHLFLSNYAIAPLVIMAALWIFNDEIKIVSTNEKQCLTFSPNKKFLLTLIISTTACFSGIYYAFFTAIIFIAGWFFCGIKKNKFFTYNSISTPVILLAMLIVLFYLNLPSIIYWMKEGSIMMPQRSPGESELYALRITHLLLPISNHYFEYLANVRHLFEYFVINNDEISAQNLGALGSIGFIFLILWLICGSYNNKDSSFSKTISYLSLSKKDRNFISDLSILNIFLVLFFTVSGFVMLVSISFPQIRSHSRISIFIAFSALSVLALISDRILQKDFSLIKKTAIRFLFLSIFILAIFDQVGRISIFSSEPNSLLVQNQKTSKKFFSDKLFVEEIEKVAPRAAVFIFPIQSFPESHDYEFLTMYLHSKTLLWSAPAFLGRQAYNWQKTFFTEGFDRFFIKMKSAGFSGVVVNRREYLLGEKGFAEITSKLKSKAKKPPIVSPNGDWTFYQI